MSDADYDPSRIIQLIMTLRRQGITDGAVLGAVERTPREVFVERAFEGQAYENNALPIECGQTISQPYIVAFMTMKLEVSDRMKVLEIGTGSGYQAAVLARLCRRLYTLERYRTLLREAETRFDKLNLTNITAKVGDGTKGWPEQAPFDRIIVTAAAPVVPEALVAQLKTGGIAVVPIDVPVADGGGQLLVKLTKTEEGFDREDLIPVRFVPLVDGVAREL
ncbi:protein-L-isoaspartate(D-aspartate) O-methyltransferase [Pyruvatibacter sp. HU-CL02332]|uniref:protein-L-isoaspartate(D-aspartate) O-methyltransferase n=1 Tax=Pyruvatibacter sp. HU-CL02332 TaxID=3127650 RepID=UPI002968C68D|nr:protein-L-isoaspartate(D-aspartate) O-methyltransferase [Alphaproteobacteria bacterium]